MTKSYDDDEEDGARHGRGKKALASSPTVRTADCRRLRREYRSATAGFDPTAGEKARGARHFVRAGVSRDGLPEGGAPPTTPRDTRSAGGHAEDGRGRPELMTSRPASKGQRGSPGHEAARIQRLGASHGTQSKHRAPWSIGGWNPRQRGQGVRMAGRMGGSAPTDPRLTLHRGDPDRGMM